MLSRTFSAGASIAARSLKYVRLAETIMEEQLGPERIATVFRLSACKTARTDCAFILLAGSVSKYKSTPHLWSAKPEATIARTLVGGDFALIRDQAAEFVAKHWREVETLAAGAEAARSMQALPVTSLFAGGLIDQRPLGGAGFLLASDKKPPVVLSISPHTSPPPIQEGWQFQGRAL